MTSLSLIKPINHLVVDRKGVRLSGTMAALIGKDGTLLPPLNGDVTELNLLITQYNLVKEAPNRLKNLRKIYEKKKEIEGKYPPTSVSQFPDYQSQIQEALFSELQCHFQEVGVFSMHERAIYSDVTAKSNQPVLTLAELLANMAQKKISILINHLSSKPEPNALTNPYSPSEPGFRDFQTFINANQMRFLGGSNSINFMIVNTVTQEVVVLKVENRLNQPKAAEAKLRAGVLQNILTPVAIERNATILDASGDRVSRTLIVTNYCTGGDLLSHADERVDTDVRLASALDIYSQMAAVLNTFAAAGYLFSDMKNPNWLVNQDGKLQIADTKAFIPIRGGIYNKLNVENKGYTLPASIYMKPPEFDSPTFSAGKAHAFMLGINLYDYLTLASEEELEAFKADTSDKFNHDIFRSEEGVALASLIKKLLQTEPARRSSVQEALTELARIQQISIDLKIACNQLLSAIDIKNPSCRDVVSQWAQRMPDRIKASKNSTQLRALQAEIQVHLSQGSTMVEQKPATALQKLKEAWRKLRKPAKQATPAVSSSVNPLKPK